jgi:hypothetical protein
LEIDINNYLTTTKMEDDTVEENKCSCLEVENVYEEMRNEKNIDPLQAMMTLQRWLQEKVRDKKPRYTELFGPQLGIESTISDGAEFVMYQKQSIDDEFQELYRALGGSDGNASWKYWKTANEKLTSKKISELTAEEMLELKYEAVDIWHFIMNVFLLLGMDAKELTNLYFAKNAENARRQEMSY